MENRTREGNCQHARIIQNRRLEDGTKTNQWLCCECGGIFIRPQREESSNWQG
jgi:hypothetical protein